MRLSLRSADAGVLARLDLAGLAATARGAERRERERRLARRALGHLLEEALPDRGWQLAERDRGPVPVDSEGRDGPPCSISHCPDWVAVALSGGAAVGVDVETRLPRNRDAVAGHLGDRSAARSDDRLLRLWTLWEARCKLRGQSVLSEPDPWLGAFLDAADRTGRPVAGEGMTVAWRRTGTGWLALAVSGEHPETFMENEEE